jgi:hypothetical protein
MRLAAKRAALDSIATVFPASNFGNDDLTDGIVHQNRQQTTELKTDSGCNLVN